MTIGPDWVSASRTRNYCERDPLLDWLNLYRERKGFVPDNKPRGYDERTDFLPFIFAKRRPAILMPRGHRSRSGPSSESSK